MSMIRHMTYAPPDGLPADVEVMSFQRLREINDRTTQRADFVVVAIVAAGHGTVTVDFAQHRVRAHDVVWVVPGAVHRWDDIDALDGTLVLFKPTAPVTGATRAIAAAHDRNPTWRIEGATRPYMRAAVDHLRLETGAPTFEHSRDVPALLLSALLARLANSGAPPAPDGSLFAAFRQAVDTHYRDHHDAGFYAELLGYSPRTLSRAVQQRAGLTAKAYLVERIVLEAKRLLAHDRLTATRCAARLGFADASNFSAFFRASVGHRPGQWLALHDAGGL